MSYCNQLSPKMDIVVLIKLYNSPSGPIPSKVKIWMEIKRKREKHWFIVMRMWGGGIRGNKGKLRDDRKDMLRLEGLEIVAQAKMFDDSEVK